MRLVEELIDDPQVRANGLLVEVEHQAAGKVKTMGPLAQFSDTPFPDALPSPALGQHTEEILLELGFSLEEVVELRQSGAVS